jgi:hypothetical protein
MNSVDLFSGIGGFAPRRAAKPLLYCDNSLSVRTASKTIFKKEFSQNCDDVSDLNALGGRVSKVDFNHDGVPMLWI